MVLDNRFRTAAGGIVIYAAMIGDARAQGHDCSPAIANKSCTVTIDRESASSPLPIKLRKGAEATLVVSKRPLETITFDVTLNDVASPDPLAAIFGAFAPILKEVNVSTRLVPAAQGGGGRLSQIQLLRAPSGDPITPILKELQWIDGRQSDVKQTLATFKTTIDAASDRFRMFRERPATAWTVGELTSERQALITAIDGVRAIVLPTGVIAGLREALKHATEGYAALARPGEPVSDRLKELEAVLNDVTANQLLLEGSLGSLLAAQGGLLQAGGPIGRINPSTALSVSRKVSAGSTTSRAATVKIAAVDVLSKAATTLATVNLAWTTTRWELSLGPLLSNFENRTFQNSPKFVNGQPLLDSAGKVNTFITETINSPSVIPFALAHVRIKEGTPATQRLAFLASGGMGISPYSKSADFGLGLTVAYRSFMVTPLWHFTRDVRLTSGLAPGLSLGSSPPALATERFWVRDRFGIVLSTRVPF